ncbi:DUF6456 domain-containing protein [Cognatishimia sp.]|uniref:DUF6456 domain-containing protein n=1 Tax=Cognatishimia sp. TaxID=2211648 RepID=UPI0035162880|nr:helix-turn-helix domain-containing protein [Cognatishimia sp.]
MSERTRDQNLNSIPTWVPPYAVRYLAHTEKGVSIRELARHSKCHASTIMRQIRRVESRRDDPLIDAALAALSARVSPTKPPLSETETIGMEGQAIVPPASDETLDAAALEVLTGLSHSGAILAVAQDLDKAVVMREGMNGKSERTAVTDRSVAEAMALKDWISCKSSGRVARYVITPQGRAALQTLVARRENSATGFHEAQTEFETEPHARAPSRVRFHSSEGPMAVLARRRDKDGAPFLSRELVRAGERLREDFELAHLEPGLTQDWSHFLAPTQSTKSSKSPASGPAAARARVTSALEALGEGLSDVALRCCCHMDGMEATEKHLGWPARSGKIVLRIALTRLTEHYRTCDPEVGDLIW